MPLQYDSRVEILLAYERARKADPSITQGQFMRAGAPGSRMKGLPGNFKSDDSAARYFRKIRSGERTGGAMYKAGSQHGPGRNVGLFQLHAKIGPDRFISRNLSVGNGSSTFDIPAIESEIRKNHRTEVAAIVALYRSRYGVEGEDFDMDEIEVKAVRHQRKYQHIALNI